uniref:Uncharacterized protein n=1 Tax=Arundo donax TaxID=35708 RepID=A0A0A9BZD7_ARUDO
MFPLTWSRQQYENVLQNEQAKVMPTHKSKTFSSSHQHATSCPVLK